MDRLVGRKKSCFKIYRLDVLPRGDTTAQFSISVPVYFSVTSRHQNPPRGAPQLFSYELRSHIIIHSSFILANEFLTSS
jgi:hypothetical protein